MSWGIRGPCDLTLGGLTSGCEHARTQVLARRDGVDYVECLDCRQIFEAEDLEPVKTEEDEE